jgi:hypothetical protein
MRESSDACSARRWCLAALLSVLLVPLGGAQDATLKPTAGTLMILGDEQMVEATVTAGGPVATKQGGVEAWVTKAPHVRLSLMPGQRPLQIYARVTEGTPQPLTILVKQPDGKWIAAGQDSVDPAKGKPYMIRPGSLRLLRPLRGNYALWVGTLDKGASRKVKLEIHTATDD